MIDSFIPGTVLLREDNCFDEQNAFKSFEQIIKATGGLSLSQVCLMTGLEPSTVQNWVKRGWVANPIQKRYGETQLARILLINMLRASLRLESIASLMKYINGNVEDLTDDIICEKELYNHLCLILFKLESNDFISDYEVELMVKEEMMNYHCSLQNDKEKLEKALVVMVMAYYTALMAKKTANLLEELNQKSKEGT